MQDFLKWIESHPVTIDLLKWLLMGVLAWILGFFRFIKTYLKRPKLEIELLTSQCSWEELGTIDGNDHNARVIFLIEAGVNNPTTNPIVIRDFTLQIKRLKKWPVWHASLNAVTMPSRVRHSLGDVTRYLKNWFSNFEEGGDALTLDAKVEGRDHQSGFLMFVSVSWGYMRPLIVNGRVPVKLKARLTTGEVLQANASILVLENNMVLESMVPGIFEHVQNRETWNIIRD